jgi:hypothetical protein
MADLDPAILRAIEKIVKSDRTRIVQEVSMDTGVTYEQARGAVDRFLDNWPPATQSIMNLSTPPSTRNPQDDLITGFIAKSTSSGGQINKIEVIKLVRQTTDLDLKDSKLVVDDYFARRMPELTKKSGCAILVIALLFLLILVIP